MKTERRHELQANQLADILTDVGEKAKPYAKMLLGLALAALVVFCAYYYLSKCAESEEATSWDKAWQALATMPPDTEALRGVVKDYPNKPAAFWSQLLLADMNLNKGVAELFVQKSTGRDLIRTAEEDYQYVADHAVQPMLREHALFGVARAQESLDKLSDASKTYELLLKDYAAGPYGTRAQMRLDELNRKSTKIWYDWFETIEPSPTNFGKAGGLTNPFDDKGTTGPSLPQLGPEFNLPLGDSKNPPPEPKPDLPKTKSDDKAKPEDKSKSDEKTKPGDDVKADQKPKTDEAKADSGKTDSGKVETPKPDGSKPAAGAPSETKPTDVKPPAASDDKSNSPPVPPVVPPVPSPKTDAGKPDGAK